MREQQQVRRAGPRAPRRLLQRVACRPRGCSPSAAAEKKRSKGPLGFLPVSLSKVFAPGKPETILFRTAESRARENSVARAQESAAARAGGARACGERRGCETAATGQGRGAAAPERGKPPSALRRRNLQAFSRSPFAAAARAQGGSRGEGAGRALREHNRRASKSWRARAGTLMFAPREQAVAAKTPENENEIDLRFLLLRRRRPPSPCAPPPTRAACTPAHSRHSAAAIPASVGSLDGVLRRAPRRSLRPGTAAAAANGCRRRCCSCSCSCSSRRCRLCRALADGFRGERRRGRGQRAHPRQQGTLQSRSRGPRPRPHQQRAERERDRGTQHRQMESGPARQTRQDPSS